MRTGRAAFRSVSISIISLFLLIPASRESSGEPSPAFAPAASGLVGYWKLDEGTVPSTAADTTGNGNTGTHMGTTIAAAGSGAPALTFANPNSLSFTAGNGDFVDIPDSPSISVTGSLTLSAWINTTATLPSANQQGIIEKFGASPTFPNGYTLRLSTPGYLSFTVRDATAPVGITTAPRVVPLATWAHVAGVYDQMTGNMTMYVDGTADATTGNQPTPPSDGANNLHIGADYGSNQFLGMIDDVRIFDRALTPAEITELVAGTDVGGPADVAPAAPTGLGATPGVGQIMLSWTASAAGWSYNVYRGTAIGGPYGTTVATGVVGTTYTDTTVAVGTTYYYVVTACRGTESANSNEGSATPTPPPVPSNSEGEEGCSCSALSTAGSGALWIMVLAAFGLSFFRRNATLL